jgi:DNA-binding SARP family transcriptional activator
MDLRLLGAVEARSSGRLLHIGPRQQRLVFAILAWHANRLVPVKQLIELVWPESPPPSAEHAIRVCVSRLRAMLADDDAAGRAMELRTQGSGYTLRVDSQLVDVHRFRGLVAQARDAATDERRVALLDRALALWRGPALDGTAGVRTRARLCAGLDEARLIAVEDRFDALLRLGRHNEVVDELTALVDEHRARERLVGQLMLALYQGGQSGRALEVCRATRAYLSKELGLDPGVPVRALELAILRHDSALAPPASVRGAGPTG